MITLMTGLPGACKTLYTMTMVDQIAKRDSRPVFYSGITDVKLEGWTEINAEEWYTCPPNSLVVIDECQRIFRPRTISKDVPLYVSELETHRHKGIDLFMITQHPMLADSALRRLAGKHIHAMRAFGMQGAMLHEWAGVKDNCDKSAGRADSIKTRWPYNKAMFGMYKSAEVHTVKRSIPTRVKLLLFLPLVLVVLGYIFYQSMQKKLHPETAATAVAQASPGALPSTGRPGDQAKAVSYKNAKDDAMQFAFMATPRYVGMPSTAPKYDELTKPVVVPIPAACVNSPSKGCKCFTQQATPINVSAATCAAIVENGFFQEFDDGSGGRDKHGLRSDASASGVVAPQAVVVSDRSRLPAASGSGSGALPPVAAVDASRWPSAALMR